MAAIDDDDAAEDSTTKSEASVKPHLRIATKTEAPAAWRRLLLRGGKDGKGPIRKALENAAIPLQHAPEFKGSLRYNESALQILIERPLPWHKVSKAVPFTPRVWSDNDDRCYTTWLERRGIDSRLSNAYEAVQMVSRERTFHPIREYLDSLKWDGVERVERWLTLYMGAEDTPYHAAVGQRWLISAVARVLEAECKADCMLVFEGTQGAGKSTAAMILAGKWFSDEVKDVGSRETAMSIAGKWVVEFAELEGFKGASLERLKAFLSRSVDRFRPPYGRATIDSARQCVFIGTTNNSEMLTDTTGNRRFWPVTVERAKVTELRRDRDQIWAEATELYRAGRPWWLDTKELQALASDAVESRIEADPWEPLVAEYLAGGDSTLGVSTSELLTEAVRIPEGKEKRDDQRRIILILKGLGYERRRISAGAERNKWRFFETAPSK